MSLSSIYEDKEQREKNRREDAERARIIQDSLAYWTDTRLIMAALSEIMVRVCDANTPESLAITRELWARGEGGKKA